MKKLITELILLMNLAVFVLVWNCGDTKKISGHYSDPYPGITSLKFIQLPVGAVRPEEWLRNTLRAWAEGVTGHLHEYRSDIFWNTLPLRLSSSNVDVLEN